MTKNRRSGFIIILLVFCTMSAYHSTLLNWIPFEIWFQHLVFMIQMVQLLVIMILKFHSSIRSCNTLKFCWRTIRSNGINIVVLLCQMSGLTESNIYIMLDYFLVSSTTGTIFVKSIDGFKCMKTGEKLFELLNFFMKNIGEEYVV